MSGKINEQNINNEYYKYITNINHETKLVAYNKEPENWKLFKRIVNGSIAYLFRQIFGWSIYGNDLGQVSNLACPCLASSKLVEARVAQYSESMWIILTSITGSLWISQYFESIRCPRSILGQGVHLTLPLSTQQLNEYRLRFPWSRTISRTASVGLWAGVRPRPSNIWSA